jgi:hypothetical protein
MLDNKFSSVCVASCNPTLNYSQPKDHFWAWIKQKNEVILRSCNS